MIKVDISQKAKPKNSWLTSVVFVGLFQILGFLGSFLGGAFKKQDWYDNSKKPPIWPPQWLFPLAWIANYTFMGLAVAQIWKKRNHPEAKRTLAVFSLHLLHNFSFIPTVYAVKKRSFYLFMDSVALALGLLTTKKFARISRLAAFWMVPYIGWLFFTTSIKFLWWQLEDK